nr:hypothetical protein GCM10020093_015350 [Planobispora longispora]
MGGPGRGGSARLADQRLELGPHQVVTAHAVAVVVHQRRQQGLPDGIGQLLREAGGQSVVRSHRGSSHVSHDRGRAANRPARDLTAGALYGYGT